MRVLVCLYCDRRLIAAWERDRSLCDICAQKILDRVYDEEPVRRQVNPLVIRDMLPWR